MANELIDPNAEETPSWLTEYYGPDDNEGNFATPGGAPIGVISYRGSKWRARYQGEETPLRDPNTGMMQPNLDVIFVDAHPGASKTFYLGSFVEGSNARPDCTSVDGITPDAASPNIQCATCAACPHNQWGTSVRQDGTRGRGKRCQDNKRTAVLLASDLANEAFGGPMLLRISPGSFAEFEAYRGSLKPRKRRLTAGVTRITFDEQAAYPRLKFQWAGFLPQEVMEYIRDNVKGIPQIDRILNISQAEVDTGDHPEAEPEVAQVAAPPQAAATVQTERAAAAKAAAATAIPRPAPAPAVQPAAPKAAAPKAAAPKPAVATAPKAPVPAAPKAPVAKAPAPAAPKAAAPKANGAAAPAPAPVMTAAEQKRAELEALLAQARAAAAELEGIEEDAPAEEAGAETVDAETGEVLEAAPAATADEDDFMAQIDREMNAIPE